LVVLSVRLVLLVNPVMLEVLDVEPVKQAKSPRLVFLPVPNVVLVLTLLQAHPPVLDVLLVKPLLWLVLLLALVVKLEHTPRRSMV
jgi:hypothetical protein